MNASAPPDPARPPDTALPFVLVEKVKGALRIVSGNAVASLYGLSKGISLADARARFPDLHVAEMDGQGDAALLTQLAARALIYTPIVAEDPPDGLILDISGAAHLFGGEEAMLHHVGKRVAPFTLRAAFGSHPDIARARARWGDLHLPEKEAVAALPLNALELEEEDMRALRRAGLTTISKIKTRSAASIASRFGADVVRALRRLSGEEDRPLIPHETPPFFMAERRFAEPLSKTDYIVTIAKELMRELAIVLAEKHQGGRAFRLQLFRTDGDVRGLTIETSIATRDADLVERLLVERIDHLADPLDPGFGYDLIRLTILRSESLAPQQVEENGTAREQQSVSTLIDRLATRYGAQTIRCLIPQDSYVPERAQAAIPIHERGKYQDEFTPSQEDDLSPPTRPLWLLDPPEKVEVVAEVPDGPPHHFRWRDKRYDVALAEGPERIGGEWWRAPQGHWPGHGAKGQGERTRDYYRIEDKDGHRFWLFRAGFYGDVLDSAPPAWYIHGLFA